MAGHVLTAYHAILSQILKRGGKVRFLVVDPHGTAAILATKRFAGQVPGDQKKTRILTSLSNIELLRKSFPAQVEVRTIDFPIEYTSYFIDPASLEALLYVERSTYKISGGIHKPKFVFKRSDGKWFHHVSTEIELMWNDAAIWRQPRAESKG